MEREAMDSIGVALGDQRLGTGMDHYTPGPQLDSWLARSGMWVSPREEAPGRLVRGTRVDELSIVGPAWRERAARDARERLDDDVDKVGVLDVPCGEDNRLHSPS